MNNSRWMKKGFTLIELIVVLFLLGLAIAITAPTMFWTLERFEARASVKELSVILRHARSRAISQKEEMRFYLDLDSQEYWVLSAQDERALWAYLKAELYGDDIEGGWDEDGGGGKTAKSKTAKSKTITPIKLKKTPIDPKIVINLFLLGEDEYDEGVSKVIFYPFGNSTGGEFEIKLAKKSKRPLSFKIAIDPITGRVKTKEISDDDEE